MAPLTTQYLAYVEAMRASNLDLAADYLLMAATLLDIKSRMLLPKPPRERTEDGEDDLKRRLTERGEKQARTMAAWIREHQPNSLNERLMLTAMA